MQAEERREPEAVNGHAENKTMPKTKNAKRPFTILAAALLVVMGGIGSYLLLTAGEQNTDDAQVSADLIPVANSVSGPVVEVAILDNQLVKKGDLLARIDDADYLAKVKQAEAELASAKAQAAAADAQVDIVGATSKGSLSSAKAAYSGSSVGVASADAQLAAAKALRARAEADVRKADSDLKRAKELREANAAPQEKLDNAQAAYDAAQASLAQSVAQLSVIDELKHAAQARVTEAAGRVTQSAPIDAQIAAAKANADLARARVEGAEAALGLAKLQLSYTKITAPADGMASKLSVHPGQYVTVGQPIVELVPTATYVVANFKETQVGQMQPGQTARISIDAYPHRVFDGRVESLSGGTGSSFSLLPADNASGNFVKVVQRVPVRIAWVNLPSDVTLRAGLSVDATVRVGK